MISTPFGQQQDLAPKRGMDGECAPSLIEVRNLKYSYPNGAQALGGLSFSVAEGEKVGIVGPNGAGKSTLLLHLNGILGGGSGELHIGGLRVEKKQLKAIRQQVGLVFQNPDDQLFCPTIYDDIAFGPRNMGRGEEEIDRLVAQSLAAVGLAGLNPRKSAFHLSLGQKKRVAVATVLAMDSRILALDEPTSALDPKGKREITQLLGRLPQTQLIITHDLNLVRAICDRVLVLAEGRLAAEGTPAAILSDDALLERYSLI